MKKTTRSGLRKKGGHNFLCPKRTLETTYKKAGNLIPMRKLTATLCLTIAVLLGSEVRGATTTEFGDPVEIKGSEFDTSMTIQLSKDGRKFRATVRIGFDTAECSGLIGNDLNVISDECRLPKLWNSEVNRLTGKFPYFVLNEEGKCVVFNPHYGGEHCYGSLESKVNFRYPLNKKVEEDKKRQALAKKAAEDKKHQALAKKAAEDKKRQELAPSKSATELENESLRKENARLENERLRRENARLKKQNQSKPKQVAKTPPPKKSPPPSSGSTGSGFFVSKLGHIVTNEHVVHQCGSVTVGDNANKQVTASVLEMDKTNDLALLRISSTQMASAETKSLISKLGAQKLGLKLVPLASGGLMRSDDIELGESVMVAGYPYGELYSNTIKVTGGMVSAVKGMGDDSGQFQMDAAVQPGNSGGPIYDENGNIVGVVISQLNKLKVAK